MIYTNHFKPFCTHPPLAVHNSWGFCLFVCLGFFLGGGGGGISIVTTVVYHVLVHSLQTPGHIAQGLCMHECHDGLPAGHVVRRRANQRQLLVYGRASLYCDHNCCRTVEQAPWQGHVGFRA